MRLPPPTPPPDYPALLRLSTTWLPEAVGIPVSVVNQARRLASTRAQTSGRREAIARHLLALAACQAGLAAAVARIPLFKTPGLLLADPHRERFYWSLDPGLPADFELAAAREIADLLAQRLSDGAGPSLQPAASGL